MRTVLMPGHGKWPFGFLLARRDGDWVLYASSPCCKSPLDWDYKAKPRSDQCPTCTGCGKKFTIGYSDTYHEVLTGDLHYWVSAWLGYGRDEKDLVTVEVKW